MWQRLLPQTINNSYLVVWPVCVKGRAKPRPASERRLLLFPPLVSSLSAAYKSVDVQVHPRVCVCVCVCVPPHRAPLYCILKLAVSKKAELRAAGAGERRALPARCRAAGSSPQIPAARDWLRVCGLCQPSVVLVEVGQGELEEREVRVSQKKKGPKIILGPI